jgi:NAD(P)H-hydrate epimerase
MADIRELISAFPKRRPDSNKGDFGHVLVIAGSSGYTGAAYLTSQAAILSGSGLVTLAIGRSLYEVMASKLIEVMVRPFFETKDLSLGLLAERDILAFSEKCGAVAVGPGISKNRETQKLVLNLVSKLGRPMVIDADGLNALAGHTDILKAAKAPVILTPHPGEMARITGKDIQEIQGNRKDIAIKFANEYNIIMVLKGRETVVANASGEVYVNQTGNPGMATGGTGDVLTGIIAGFIGQGVEPFTASSLAVYFHGLAGDLAAGEKGVLSLIATDLLNKLPEVLKTLA